MNVLAVAANLAGVAANRINRFGRHASKRVQRLWRSGQKSVESSVHAGRRAAADTLALPGRADKAATRTRKRVERFREHVVAPWLEQRAIERELAALARGTDPKIRSKPGVTALDLAKQYNNAAAIAILEKL